MRGLRTSFAILGLLGIVPSFAFAESPQLQILRFVPALKGIVVEYDTPKGDEAINACKYEVSKNPSGYLLSDGQGKLLRRLIDSNGDGKLDQWSYYQDGFEVYREVDIDGDKSVDEVRWLNGGGTRIGTVKSNIVTGWKRISAEEASKVLVNAIAAKDLALLETVMATPEELTALGVPAGEVARVKAAADKRATAVAELWKGLVGWEKTTNWLRLDAAMPHVIPVDATAGLKADITLYENAVIFAANGGQADKTAFLQASEIVQVGPAWKFVDLPRAIDPSNQAAVVAQEGGIRSAIFRGAGNGGPVEDPAYALALKDLAEYDKANAELLNGGNGRNSAKYYIGRVPKLRAASAAAAKPEDKLAHDKQVIDSIAAAYATGFYADGKKVLEDVESQKGKLGNYAAYRMIQANFALDNSAPDANQVAIQKRLLTGLKAFLDKYPTAEETPDVMLQLASNNELNADEKEAREYYTKLADTFPNTEQGKKAAGALKRLDIVGKALVLKGKGLDGQVIDVSKYQGKTLLVTFWATWAGPVKRDLPEIAKLYDKNKAKGFEIVGICFDNEQADVVAFVKENSVLWPQVYEQGGMESRLANEFGIISLPTMFLVDANGKVVNRTIRTAADLEVQLEKVLAGAPGVADRGGREDK